MRKLLTVTTTTDCRINMSATLKLKRVTVCMSWIVATRSFILFSEIATSESKHCCPD
jgi:hypothetical protein